MNSSTNLPIKEENALNCHIFFLKSNEIMTSDKVGGSFWPSIFFCLLKITFIIKYGPKYGKSIIKSWEKNQYFSNYHIYTLHASTLQSLNKSKTCNKPLNLCRLVKWQGCDPWRLGWPAFWPSLQVRPVSVIRDPQRTPTTRPIQHWLLAVVRDSGSAITIINSWGSVLGSFPT